MVLLTAIAGINFIYQPAKKRIKEIELKQSREKERNKLLKQVDKRQKDIQKYTVRLSRDKGVSYFTNYVSKLAKESNVELVSIKPGTLQKESYYQKLPLNLKIKASYNETGQLISKLESSRQFILIENISFEKKRKVKRLKPCSEISMEVNLDISLLCSI